MKRIAILLALLAIGTNIFANGPFYEALQKMEYHTVPRNSGPDWKKYKWGPEFWVSEKEYTFRLYKDIRLKETYVFKNSPWPGIKVLCRMPIPNSSNTLLYCVADDSECTGELLIIVNKQGDVLDSIISGYFCNRNLMQWSISSNWGIKITSLSATDADNFKIWLFTWFIGQRTDCNYIIQNGKFVLTGKHNYQKKKYTAELLETKGYDLMKGGETPIQ